MSPMSAVTLRSILYPNNFKKWIVVPEDFPQDIWCDILGKSVQIKRQRDYADRPELHFFAPFPFFKIDEGDDEITKSSISIDVCNLQLNTYLYPPRIDVHQKDHDFEMTVMVGDKDFAYRTLGKFYPETNLRKSLAIFERQHRRWDMERYDQSILTTAQNDQVTLHLKLMGFSLEHVIKLDSYSEYKKIQDTTTHAFKDFYQQKWWEWKRDEATVNFRFDTDDNFLEGNVILNFSHPNLWPHMQKLIEKVYGIKNCRGLYEGWLPLEIIDTACDLTSYIIMAFHPTRFPKDDEPLIKMLRYDPVGGQFSRRPDFDSDFKPFNTGWKTEIHSESVKAYLQLENEFSTLVNKHLVALSESEFKRAAEIFQKIQEMRKGKKIECQICFLQNSIYQTQKQNGSIYNNLNVCKYCASLFK